MLNVSGGVRLGWITGVVMFPMWALTEIPEVVSGRLATALEQQMKNMPTRDPALQQQLASFFQSGLGIATMVLFTLAFLFLLIIGLSVAGGALGARMIRNRRVAG
ncbi:MAG: hypothetical protein LAQ30_29760 [Acidobacteriia bacterium]|nr:hypothetical protein [Terriglobia bacterium]